MPSYRSSFSRLATTLVATSISCTAAHAAESGQQLPDILVTATAESPGVQRLEGDQVRSRVRSDLSEALSLIPSVRVDDTASSSLRQGELKPAEFSIRGAAPFQNRITLDGASIDSFLDPGRKTPPGVGSVPERTAVEGHSQALFINPDFLSSIEVLDTNISAREGGFTGGVVRAETRRYEGRDSFRISHRRTDDGWTRFHVDEAQAAEFQDGAGQYPTGTPGEFQPDFRKSSSAISGTTRIGDIGLFAGLSEQRATLHQQRLASMDFAQFAETGQLFSTGEPQRLDRHSRFATLRADLLERDYDLNATLAISDYSEDSFLINFLDSDFQRDTRGINLGINHGRRLGDSRLDASVSLGHSQNRRQATSDELNNYQGRNFYTEGAFVGSFGSLANEQYTAGARLALTTPLGSEEQSLSYGGELNAARYQQVRDRPFTERTFQPPTPLGLATGGIPVDEHTLFREVHYDTGTIRFNNLDAALFAELDGSTGRFFWRPGMRLERDGWLDNVNLAPRLMAGIYLDSQEDYQLRLGANRYYGKSFLSYRLREREKSLLNIRQRTESYNPDAPLVDVDPDQEWAYRQLDTPYDDEFSLGLYGQVLGGSAGFQAVLRQGRDQIRTQRDPDSDLRWFANSGRSDTHQLDLYWHSAPFHWGSSLWAVNASLSWMDKTTDATYSGRSGGYLGADRSEQQVIFEGERILREELPAADFATPVSANLDLVTRTFNNRLIATNSLSFTNGARQLRRTGRDAETGLDEFAVTRLSSALRWDLSVEASLLAGDASPYLKADIINVANSRNAISAESGVQLFGLGRQLWLEVGYRF
ncbi:TonB-dependent receptor plug domain-containing protein [Halomonas mongoliensis]|uniref:TonB-dependent receptor plug domain-containing protein n=1 Tax=Halomonas mongoliensis TaxID=321265 RepID=UPI00403B0944